MDGRVWSFVLPYERPPLSANRRKHWSPAHREYRETKNDLYYLGKHWQQQHGLKIAPGTRVDVLLRWFPGSNRVADSDNQTDSLKPILDGLTLAGVWPDDNARHVRIAAAEVVPRSHDPEDRSRPTVILEIREVTDDGANRPAGHGDQHADGRDRASTPERHRKDSLDRTGRSVSGQRHRRSAGRYARRH
jgi:hypothetical protein